MIFPLRRGRQFDNRRLRKLRTRQGHQDRLNANEEIFLAQLRGQQAQSAGHENKISNPVRLENKEAHNLCTNNLPD